MYARAKHHDKTQRPRNQAEHNEIGADAHPEPEDTRSGNSQDKERGLEFIIFLSAVAERGDGTSEKETAE